MSNELQNLMQASSVISVFCRFTNVLKYLRFNSKLSNMLVMVKEVVYEIRYFFVMIFLFVLNLFLCQYIILVNGFEGYEVLRYDVLKQTFGIMFGAFSEISQGFGDDSFPGYNSARGFWVWLVFLFSALLINVTLLNLLISIISDVYA